MLQNPNPLTFHERLWLHSCIHFTSICQQKVHLLIRSVLLNMRKASSPGIHTQVNWLSHELLARPAGIEPATDRL